MDSFLSGYKNLLVLVGVLLAQVIGLAMQIRRPNPAAPDVPPVRLIRLWAVGLFSPPEEFLQGAGRGLRSAWANYLDLRGARRENRQLQEQIARLRLEQAALLEDARQGQRLQQLLAFKEHYVYRTVPAQIIGTSGTDQSRVLYIDKGSADGLRPDMAVITPDGIVGKLKDVFPHTAQVLEISDQTSGTGILLEETRLRGVLRGNALGQPQVINMLPDERVKPGERVITSGGDQIFPRGLAVGVVDRVAPDAQNPPFMDILVKPAANLGHLEELLIITQTSDRMPAEDRRDLAQSEAAGVAAERQQRASDILAERLPGIGDPNPNAAGGAADSQAVSLTGVVAPPPQPPPPLHTDRYSPDATPPAADLIPGKPFTVMPVPLAGDAGSRGTAGAKPKPQSGADAPGARAAKPAGESKDASGGPAARPLDRPANRPAKAPANGAAQ
jgi:rod shape-determining protein MreC